MMNPSKSGKDNMKELSARGGFGPFLPVEISQTVEETFRKEGKWVFGTCLRLPPL